MTRRVGPINRIIAGYRLNRLVVRLLFRAVERSGLWQWRDELSVRMRPTKFETPAETEPTLRRFPNVYRTTVPYRSSIVHPNVRT